MGQTILRTFGCCLFANAFHLPSIGGKDSMSGTFKDKHVPPTLVSFAIITEKASKLISPEFKKAGNYIYLLKHQLLNPVQINVEQLKKLFDFIYNQIQNGKIISAFTLQFGGIMEALAKMSFGNDLGFNIDTKENLSIMAMEVL